MRRKLLLLLLFSLLATLINKFILFIYLTFDTFFKNKWVNLKMKVYICIKESQAFSSQ